MNDYVLPERQHLFHEITHELEHEHDDCETEFAPWARQAELVDAEETGSDHYSKTLEAILREHTHGDSSLFSVVSRAALYGIEVGYRLAQREQIGVVPKLPSKKISTAN